MKSFLEDIDDSLLNAARAQLDLHTDEVEDCCKNCAYCAEVRKWPLYNTIVTKCCIYYVLTERSDYILEVTDTDRCEVFRHKEKGE
jgi:hypothetical protein